MLLVYLLVISCHILQPPNNGHYQSVPLEGGTSSTNDCHFLLRYDHSYRVSFHQEMPQCVFESGEAATVYSCQLEKFPNLIPLSVLVLCKVIFPMVHLKLCSHPTFALKCSTIFLQYLGNC